MEFYSVSGNDTETQDATASDAPASAIVADCVSVVVTLNDEQYQNLVGESIFTEMTFETQLGLFTSSIAVGFALASLVIIIKLGLRAFQRLIQRI